MHLCARIFLVSTSIVTSVAISCRNIFSRSSPSLRGCRLEMDSSIDSMPERLEVMLEVHEKSEFINSLPSRPVPFMPTSDGRLLLKAFVRCGNSRLREREFSTDEEMRLTKLFPVDRDMFQECRSIDVTPLV
uniref:Putative secreted protein n=1 Tax=Anopheles triannulatus TaxID=58253 RepID=A0A2M4B3A3_9DIPT